jgi:hypothetical protein
MSVEGWLQQNGGISRLTLKMDNATADEIAAEVLKRTGVALVPEPRLRAPANGARPVPRFSVEASGDPFWQAIHGWNRGKDVLQLSRYPRSLDRWLLVSRPALLLNGHETPFGPCLLVTSEVSVINSRRRVLSRTAQEKNAQEKQAPSAAAGSLSISNWLLIDPHLRASVSAQFLQLDSATDDQGRSIGTQAEFTSPALTFDSHPFPTSLKLAAPLADARMVNLKGALRLAVVSMREKWRIDPRATPRAQREWETETGKVSLHFHGLEEKSGQWLAKFELAREAKAPPPTFAPGKSLGLQLGGAVDLRRAIRFLNSDAEEVAVVQSSTALGTVGTMKTTSLELRLDGQGQIDREKFTPTAIVVDMPLQWREVQLPFEVKDLPLP